MSASHKEATASGVEHVFVLMLENHSFDHILGYSGIKGIDGLDGKSFSNSWTHEDGKVTTYPIKAPAVDPMTTDPNHEYQDTMEQLCGQAYALKDSNPYKNDPNAKYPTIDHSGYAANYGRYGHESTGRPAADHVGDIMSACSQTQSGFLTTLAANFTVCDKWFASIPGPTWPNRLFMMAASSSGLDDSPGDWEIFKWEFWRNGIQFQNGSIFDLLRRNGLKYGLYNDRDNRFATNKAPFWGGGEIPLAAALDGIHKDDFYDFGEFAKHLNSDTPYPYQFTLIEPNYGDLTNSSYKGGSSQHPEDGIPAGDKLIAATFNAIRKSRYWEKSLLIITYDEHGGYFDHVKPPAATPPGDKPIVNLNKHGFTFNHLGVRVPAVIVSPLVATRVDSTVYDHTSILKTVETIFGLDPLTARDKAAASFAPAPGSELRTECLPRLDVPETPTPVPATEPIIDEAAFLDPTPLPPQGNVIAHKYIAAKIDFEMSGGTELEKQAIRTRVEAIHTRGELRKYFAEVLTKSRARES